MSHRRVKLKTPSRFNAVVWLVPLQCVMLCLTPVAVSGQVMPQNRTLAADKTVPQQFVAALDALSTKWKVAFIAEGEPLIKRVSRTSPALPASPTLEEAVQQVANSYDYAVAQQGTVFVLTKLYSNPGDIPDVTLEECRLPQ